MDLSGKTALVTGGARGIGRAVSQGLADAGARVVAADRAVGEMESEAEVDGRRLVFRKMDVARMDEVRRVVDEVARSSGGVDILVNNAGVMGNFALMNGQTPERFAEDISINLIGAFHCSKVVWSKMAEKGWGRIINMSSISARGGAFAAPGYGASKAGLLGLTRTLAIEGGGLGITVNAVMPGLIDTEPVRKQGAELLDRVRQRIPAGRLGRPEEVAALVTFLVSEQAGYITGASVPVTGGIELFTI
ncbi:MAG: SDR family oxidoreductase [Proteobacteria bacterium]|nr:SDR family oxidoreductase [Pseudomonadota bacterium]